MPPIDSSLFRRLCHDELGNGDVVRTEPAVPHLVELDEAPGPPRHRYRQHEERVHAEIAHDERLGRVDVTVDEGDGSRLAAPQDLGGEWEVGYAIGGLVAEGHLAQRVLGGVDDVVADDARRRAARRPDDEHERLAQPRADAPDRFLCHDRLRGGHGVREDRSRAVTPAATTPLERAGALGGRIGVTTSVRSRKDATRSLPAFFAAYSAWSAARSNDVGFAPSKG